MPFNKESARKAGKKSNRSGIENKLTPKRNLIWTLILYELKDDIKKVIKNEINKNPKESIELLLSISKLFSHNKKAKILDLEICSAFLNISETEMKNKIKDVK